MSNIFSPVVVLQRGMSGLTPTPLAYIILLQKPDNISMFYIILELITVVIKWKK